MDKNDLTEATLDPPGSIAVIGAGPLGLEAALYGRYLGYDVTLFESVAVACRLDCDSNDPIPMLPDRCASPLALSALRAQKGDDGPDTLPVKIGQWVSQIWKPLAESDLLRGRLECPALVTKIEHAPIQDDQPDDVDDSLADEDLPPDFRLTFRRSDPENGDQEDCVQSQQVEAVILATGSKSEIEFSMAVPCEYLFEIEMGSSDDAGSDFLAGLKQIVAIYAALGGRPDLDLYRPKRG